MEIYEFAARQTRYVQSFIDWYIKNARANPSAFPTSLTQDSWSEKYEIWKDDPASHAANE